MKTPLTAVLAFVLLAGRLASAQDVQPVSKVTGQPPKGESRIELGLAFAQTFGSSSFSSTLKLREYAEDGSFNSTYAVGNAPGPGFDLQYNLKKSFGIRVGGQTFARKSNGTFTAQIPHPFFFARPRTVSGTQSGLGFTETAFSLTGVYRGGSGKWKVNIEGGVARFSVSTTVAEKISYGDVYPYDTVTFSGIVPQGKKATPIGVAAGLEVGREISSSAVVVIQGRFTQGSSDIDISGQKVKIKAGGAQVRIGMRFVVARKRAKT